MDTHKLDLIASWTFFAFVILQAIDVTLTLWGWRLGLAENNPLITNLHLLFLAKAISTLIVFVLYKANLLYINVLMFLNGCLFAISLNNLILIIRVIS